MNLNNQNKNIVKPSPEELKNFDAIKKEVKALASKKESPGWYIREKNTPGWYIRENK